MKTKVKFKVWKTIILGTGLKTANGFRQALETNGFKIDALAYLLLGHPAFKPAAKKQKVDLVVVSVAELGFPYGATRQEIYDRAKEIGLDLCPPEVGPQLRLQYNDQPRGEGLVIGMKPLTGSGSYLDVFNVDNYNAELWFSGNVAHHDDFWGGAYCWVFRRK